MAGAAKALWSRLRRLPWWRFAAGVVGGGAALLVTFVMRLLGLGVFLPETAFEGVVAHVPGALESFFIGNLGEGAKVLGVTTAVFAILAAYGIGAVFFRRVQTQVPGRWPVVAVYTVGSAVLVLFVALPLLGGGIAGSQTDAGAAFAAFSQLVGGWAYGAILDYLLVDVAARHPEGFNPSRRAFFIGAAASLGALALAAYGFGTSLVKTGRLAFASVADMFARELTPTSEFYVVTKNVIDPAVDLSGPTPTVDGKPWQLTVDGASPDLATNPLTLSYSALMARTPVEEYTTLECVSNEVGGNLMSTAKWSGIRVADLLTEAGVQPVATWIEFASADGYTVAIPIAKAMDPATLLVLRMNDAVLEGPHGAPARILVPGKYGMFSAKWVTSITALAGEFQGFWQTRGWTNDGPDKTTAIIATPAPDAVVPAPVTIGGVAFAGDRGIQRVEVSTDDGVTWNDATLATPLDPLRTWVLWTFPFNPSAGGAYRVRARATDGTGTVQTAASAPPFPDGASGYDAITLYVTR